MEETPIRKARNLGGKLGKKVLALLPESEQTMGSIARLLSVHDLSKALGKEMGQLVFNLCRGNDDEPVKETFGALIKSITASKNFSITGLKDIQKWIALLAEDVITRVEIDTKRNHRVPKRCTVHYLGTDDGKDARGFSRCTVYFPCATLVQLTLVRLQLLIIQRKIIASADWKEQSIRVEFPKEAEHPIRLQKLIAVIYAALEKRNLCLIRRLGLSATDFEVRSLHGIDAFFSKANAAKLGLSPKPRDKVKKSTPADQRSTNVERVEVVSEELFDPDFEYAKKLQASYDKEHTMLAAMEQTRVKERARSKNGIDAFFVHKKQK